MIQDSVVVQWGVWKNQSWCGKLSDWLAIRTNGPYAFTIPTASREAEDRSCQLDVIKCYECENNEIDYNISGFVNFGPVNTAWSVDFVKKNQLTIYPIMYRFFPLT